MLSKNFLTLYGLSGILEIDRTDVRKNLEQIMSTEDEVRYALTLEKPKAKGVHFLNIKTHGCNIRVYLGNEILYEYGVGYARAGKMVGKIFSEIEVPEAAYGSTLLIETVKEDINGSTAIEIAESYRAADARWYFLTNETLGSVTAPVYIILGMALIIVSLFTAIDNKKGLRLFAMGGIFLCMAIELLDTGGHYLLFWRDPHSWNILFELDCYLLPFFCMLYYIQLEKNRLPLLAGQILASIDFLLFTIASAGCIFSGSIALANMKVLYPYHMGLHALMVIFGMYWLIRKRSYSKNDAVITVIIAVWMGFVILFNLIPNPTKVLWGNARLDMETLEAMGILLVLLYQMVQSTREEIREKEEKDSVNQRLEQELSDMRLQNFTQQMNPHFLYNTLISIQEIIFEDPEYASRLVGDFTKHLRNTIRSMSGNAMIPFEEELKNIEAYANIEKIRFEDRLTVEYDIQVRDFKVLSLSIQPLVENAIRHGIYERGEQGGKVLLRSYEDEDHIVVEVKDTGVGFDLQKVQREIEEGKRDSTGLRNLMLRLKKGMNAEIRIDSTVGAGTTVIVCIPRRVPQTMDRKIKTADRRGGAIQ